MNSTSLSRLACTLSVASWFLAIWSWDLEQCVVLQYLWGTFGHGSFCEQKLLWELLQEGLDALSDVIYHIETYDVTTIRASTPMFLMSRKIKALGVKMVISGEGSDEIFGGYLYFHKAPNKEELHRETCRKVGLSFLASAYILFCL